jgi:hypothetical protein
MYYEQLDILPVLGVHSVSQVVKCGSKRGLRPQVQVHRHTDQRLHSDMITLPTISIDYKLGSCAVGKGNEPCMRRAGQT